MSFQTCMHFDTLKTIWRNWLQLHGQKRSYKFRTAWGGVQVYRNGESLHQVTLIICSEQSSSHRFSWLASYHEPSCGLTWWWWWWWWWWWNWGGFFFTARVNLLSQGDTRLGSVNKFHTAIIRCLRGWQIKHSPIHQDLCSNITLFKTTYSRIKKQTNIQWVKKKVILF